MFRARWIVAVLVLWICVFWTRGEENLFDWQRYDQYDQVRDRMDAVNRENCQSKSANELYLPENVMAQLPRFNRLLTSIIYPNRTDLLHVHNMALNRAFFYSYIYQKLNNTDDFMKQPGLMYYYFSSAADVSANEYNINGSAVFFDSNATYANWYRNLPFNFTLPLFGPRAWRFDDYNDPTNWLREPTNATIDIIDYGAGPQSNYTHKAYKVNQWYQLWLPDGWEKQGLDSVRKHSYDVGIKYSNETGRFKDDEFQAKVFFGPPSPGQKEQEHIPVVFTQPFYDCGRSNKWIVSAVAPVVDQIPRYLDWFHLRRYRFVASVAMDIDFLTIDMNQCPISIGNEPPNFFAGTARCKQTTICEPLYGWGFRRGGYKCMCKPGYRLPPWQHGPFMGADIESATEDEHRNGFNCLPVELRQVIPVIRGNESGLGTPEYDPFRKKREVVEQIQLTDFQPEWVRKIYTQPAPLKASLHSRILDKKQRLLRAMGLKEVEEAIGTKKRTKLVARQPHPHEVIIETMRRKANPKKKFVPRYKREAPAHSRKKRQAFDSDSFARMAYILEHKETVTKDNCMTYKKEDLELPGDVSFGVEHQFRFQAATALRLSHFLSNFLQNIDRYEEYGNLRGDNLLNVELIFGEVLANVMGDLKIKGSGVFFDIDKFEGPNDERRQYFGPYAYRYEEETDKPTADRANTHFRAIDFAGYPNHYLDKHFFKTIKERWQSNVYGLTKYTEKPMIRSDVDGTSLKKFELYPMYYRAPNQADGSWSAPYFDCEGNVNDWVATYSIPFFGLNSIRSALEFKGVVTVDVKLDELDISQCPSDYYIPNAFKATARCHYESTYCEHLPGKKFVKGSYKCECRQGFEYPFNDRAWYFDGQTMEEEYRKKVMSQTSRFDTLKCRIAGASQVGHSWVLMLMLSGVYFLSRDS